MIRDIFRLFPQPQYYSSIVLDDTAYAESRGLAKELVLERLNLVLKLAKKNTTKQHVKEIKSIIKRVKKDKIIGPTNLISTLLQAYGIATINNHPEESFKKLVEVFTILREHKDFNKQYEGL